MRIIIDFDKCELVDLNEEILKYICYWKYEKPYNIYNLELNEYLRESSTWGLEQFVLVGHDNIIAYVACQIIDGDMWIGWSLRPDICGKGMGKVFAKKCIDELINIKKYCGKHIYLKVANWNTRAIKVYEKLGFVQEDKLVRLENENYIEYIIMKKNIQTKNVIYLHKI